MDVLDRIGIDEFKECAAKIIVNTRIETDHPAFHKEQSSRVSKTKCHLYT
jgi:hypothetical protein